MRLDAFEKALQVHATKDARIAEDVAAMRKGYETERAKTQAELKRLGDAQASANVESKRQQNEIETIKAEVKSLKEGSAPLPSQLKVLEEQVSDYKQALDKLAQKVYASPSVQTIDTATAESLKQEVEEMKKTMKAIATCLVVLPTSVCNLEAAPAQKQLPPKVVAEVPTTESSDMWTRYPDFFARFKEVWTYCPVVLELDRAIEIAKSFNDRTDLYERRIAVCKADKDKIPNRAWPPNARAAKMLKERFFELDEATRSWVQRR